jgi:hypothetical protein
VGRTLLRNGKTPRDRKDLKTAMKDNDFITHVAHITFVEKPGDPNNSDKTLLEILKEDAKFLGRCGIIDYSLLLGEIEDDP